MASLGHRLEHSAARLGLWLARVLPAGVADKFGAFLGRLAHALMKSRRELARDNLRQALGDELTEGEIRAVARTVFENTGRTLTETARFKKLGSDGIRAMIIPAGRRLIREALAEGKGVVIASAHFGNWEMMGAFLPVFGFPTVGLYYTQHNRAINDMMIELRQSTGMVTLEVPANTRQAFRALRQNKVLIIAADQHASAGTLVMDFFGRPAAVARGPALFALRSGCPLIPMLLYRDKYNRHIVLSGEAITPPATGDEEADVRSMTEKYIAFLEHYIRKYPGQWLWTHNRWKLKEASRNSDVAET
jgi:KDO2-lipid IV(A) lauroyltransferase